MDEFNQIRASIIFFAVFGLLKGLLTSDSLYVQYRADHFLTFWSTKDNDSKGF